MGDGTFTPMNLLPVNRCSYSFIGLLEFFGNKTIPTDAKCYIQTKTKFPIGEIIGCLYECYGIMNGISEKEFGNSNRHIIY